MSFKKFLLLFLFIPTSCFALTKAPIDITKMDIVSLSKALEDEIITSEQLVNLYLDRINEYSDYNAIITINENSIEEAKALDEERQNGSVRSILHGIPIIVKDNIDVAGLPTTGGAKALSDNYPNEDATVIKKLKEAGAIIIAKSNMSEFAMQASSSSSSYGTVKNSYDQTKSSYGSSGGSAVSVALSLAAAALGTDTNSSVRVPAAANGLVGYRPSFGTISKSGVIPYDPERDTVGTLTKTVSDSIILTNIIMGYDETDSKSQDKEYQNYTLTMASLEGITIGVPTSFLKGDNNNSLAENKETYEDIYNLMTEAISQMEANGANIVYIDTYYTSYYDNLVSSTYSGYLFCDSFNSYIKNTTGTIKSFEELNVSNKKISTLTGYAKSCNTTKTLTTKNQKKQEYQTYIEQIYKENNLDVIVYPTTKNKLLNIGASGLVNLSAHASSTLGYPAISLPLGLDSNNLPYGIEFMALKNEDNKLLNIAYVYENLTSLNLSSPNNVSLYEIDEEVEKLLTNYQSHKKIILKTNWQKKVKNYFKTYSDSETVIEDAKELNKLYQRRLYLKYTLSIVAILLIFLTFKLKFKAIKKYPTNKFKLNRKVKSKVKYFKIPSKFKI
jgi:Asp-tRNA(Asn)/Glu-tRNA(Gln) amidotransferase A subunit family amidase